MCFAFVAVGLNSSVSRARVARRSANVYQIEKDVMYLNLIYVYLVTSWKMPFQWETNSIWQFTNSTRGLVSE